MQRRLYTSFLPIALLVAAVASAQDTEGLDSQEGVFFETLEVNLINVEVFVTDKKGNPITGLTKDDFEIYENRRPVTMTNFYAVEGGKRVGPWPGEPQEAAPSARRPAVPGVEEKPPIPEEQRLHLVVYIDNFNIRPFNRNRVFRRLRGFLNDKLDSDDRVMLVSYDRSLHIRHQFTTDPQLIASTLFELEKLTGHGVHADSDRRDLLRDIEEAEQASDIEWRVRQYAESLFNDLSFSIDALKEMITSLAGLPGRKAFLYVSDGLPMQPGEDLYHALSQKFQDSSVLTRARDTNSGRRFRELAAQASTSRVTFYAIDAAGLRVATTASAQYSSPNPRGAGITTLVDSIHFSNIQSPLLLLADLTGGRAIYNTNDVGPGLTKMASDFDRYYSLGYTPAHSGTGRYYQIAVKVKRKGLRVRHRKGYRDKPLAAKMEDGTRSTLMYGFERNPLQVDLRFGRGSRVEKNRYDVPFAVRIPLDKIVLVPREEFHEARIKIYFGAMDEKGGFSPVRELRLPITIPNDEVEVAKKSGWVYRDQLRMRPGGHRVAVGVWDEIGATGSFVTKSLVVGGE